MPRIPILPPEKAPSESVTVYREFYTRMQFPAAPNFIKTQGHSPTVARGTWEVVRNVLVLGKIPRWKKEMLFVAISKERNCQYCTAAHIACCRMLGVKPEALENLIRDVNSIPDPGLREMIGFGLKCARDPQSLDESDYAKLARQGMTQAEIMEWVAMSAFAVYANIIADATAMEPDAMFDAL